MNLHLPHLFAAHASPGFLWVRVCGVGFVLKDTRRHGLSFSERNRCVRVVRVGRWLVRWLPRWKEQRP